MIFVRVCGKGAQIRISSFFNISCKDMNEWRSYQKRIAESFGTDKSVINPSRIMRVPGTITHPNKKKQLKGYITEMVSMNIRQYNGTK